MREGGQSIEGSHIELGRRVSTLYTVVPLIKDLSYTALEGGWGGHTITVREEHCWGEWD